MNSQKLFPVFIASILALTALGQNRRRLLALLLLVALALSSNLAYAHAILVEASPSANSTVAGPSIPIKLRFSVRLHTCSCIKPITREKGCGAANNP